MIQLNIQLKLIIFSFICGFIFGFLIEKYNIYIRNKKELYKLFTTFIMFFSLDIIYFFGIYIISNAVFHIYSIISLLLGIVVYKVIIDKIMNCKR